MQNIDIYYESLKQVYDQIVNWKEPESKPPLPKRIVNWLTGIIGIIFVLSLIPIIPAVFIYIGGRAGLVIRSFDFSVATFGNFILVWIVAAAISGMLLAILLRLNNKMGSTNEDEAKPPQTLSPEQVTFIAIYEAYKELKIYFVSHIDRHVDNSLKALRKILPARYLEGDVEYLRKASFLLNEEIEKLAKKAEGKKIEIYEPEIGLTFKHRYALRASFENQILTARKFLRTFEKYAWFQLDSETKTTLQALSSFENKIPFRLKGREDLPAVLSVLENLSKFIYAYLPEHKTYMNTEALKQLQMEGAEGLKQFVKEVNELTPLEIPQQHKNESEVSQPTLREKFQAYYEISVFLRFTIWFILILILTTIAVFLINQFVNLSPDTMATVIIGTSVASAAALAGFLPKASKSG